MSTLIKNISESEIEILFEFSWEEFLPYVEMASLEIGRNLKIPGFRPGKAPLEMVIKEVGQEKVFFSAAESTINKEYKKFILEKKIEVVSSPKIEILKLAAKNPFCFKAVVAIFPEFDLPDYKEIASHFSIPKKEVSVTPEEIEEAMDRIKKSKTEFEELETPAKENDFLEIEYSSPQIEDERLFKDVFFLGGGNFVKGFEENLIGMKRDEEKRFGFVFPQQEEQGGRSLSGARIGANKDLAGKEVSFKVKVKKIQKAKIPELNDDFSKQFGFQNLIELKEAIAKEIKKEKEKHDIQKRKGEVLEKIGEQTKIPISERLLDLEKEQMMKKLKQRVENGLKISFEKYLEEIEKSEEDLKKTLTNEAKKGIQTSLILKKIGEKENITVEEEEIGLMVNEFLKNFSPIEKNKDIDIEALREYYRNIIYTEKVFQLFNL